MTDSLRGISLGRPGENTSSLSLDINLESELPVETLEPWEPLESFECRLRSGICRAASAARFQSNWDQLLWTKGSTSLGCGIIISW